MRRLIQIFSVVITSVALAACGSSAPSLSKQVEAQRTRTQADANASNQQNTDYAQPFKVEILQNGNVSLPNDLIAQWSGRRFVGSQRLAVIPVE